MVKARSAKGPAGTPANDRELPDISNAIEAHPMLGEGPIHTVWVYRCWRNKHGKEETTCKLMEGDPKELQVESQILSQWGPGKYRVIGRDRNHKLVGGAQRIFRFEDETGKVPEDLEEPTITGASGAAGGPAIGGQSVELLTIITTLREQLKASQDTMKAELERAEQRRKADMESMGGFNTELIKVFGARDARPEGGGEYEKMLKHRVDTLEADLRTVTKERDELRTKSLEQGWKLEHRQKSDSYQAKIAEEGMPRVFAMIDRFLESKPGVGKVFKLPTLAEMQARVANRETFPLEEIKGLLDFHDRGALPADLWPIVQDLGLQTGLLEKVVVEAPPAAAPS